MATKMRIIYFTGLLVICYLIIHPAYAYAQSTWAHVYGGSNDDNATSIRQTNDGGYIVAGYTNSFGAGNDDIWILKLDSSGNVIGQKTYGGLNDDYATSIRQTNDGGYIVAGGTTSFGAGDADIWILKLDSAGNVTWQKTYGGSSYDNVVSIEQTSDGGYIIAGGTTSFGAGGIDVLILKLDSSGNVTWQKTYGGSDDEFVYSIQQTTDGGYIAAGYTKSFGAGLFDFWILKLDSFGNVSWQETYGGSNYDYPNSIQQTSDGGYIVAGSTQSFGVGIDMWILKLDFSGNVIWQKTYGGSDIDHGFSIEQTSDGGYIVAGNTDSFSSGYYDFLILKLDSSGNISWQKTYGGSNDDYPQSIRQTSDGGYIVAGYTKSFGAGGWDVWILKLNPDGTMGSSCTFINNTSISPISSSASPADTVATISLASVITTNTGISAVNSTATDTMICSCSVPVGLSNNTAADLNPCTDTGVQISWTMDPGNWGDGGYGSRSYTMLRDGITIASGIPYGTSSFVDTTGTNSVIYSYAVRYTNGCGMSATTTPGANASDEYCITTCSVNNTAADVNACADTGVAIAWNIDPDNWCGGGTGTRTYDILRNGTVIAAGLAYGTTTYIDATATNGTSYLYAVRYNGGCNSCTTIGANAADNVGTNPTVMNTTAVDNNPMLDTGVDVSWPVPTDWGDNGVNPAGRGFRVYRNGVDISGLLPASTFAFNDNTGVNNTNCTYHVEVINGCGLISSYNSMIAMDAVGITVSSWAHLYGGPNTDFARSIKQTSDGGYIVAGSTNSFGAGNYDFWVLKLDSSGNATWQKTYGGSGDDEAYSIQQTGDGGYVVAGVTSSFGAGLNDAWVLKLDSSGNVIWQKIYGGSNDDWTYFIQQTSDGGYIVAGRTDSFGAGNDDIWVLKLDSSGNIIWQKTYGGSNGDLAISIEQTSDGGYIVAGYTDSFGAGLDDAWVLKLDSSGNVIWQKTYGGSNYDSVLSIEQTSDGGYIIAGSTDSFGAGNEDIWVLKLDSTGNVTWQKTYGGSNDDFAISIEQTFDGGYIVEGVTYSFSAGDDDIWVLKLDSSGNVTWQKTYGGSNWDWATSIQQTSDAGYIVAGSTSSFGAGFENAWVLKLKPDGTMDSSCTFINNTVINPVNSSASSIGTVAATSSPSLTVTNTGISGINSTAFDTTMCSSSCFAPNVSANNTAADLDPCADTGVLITWVQDPVNWGDAGIGTRSYAVLRNGTMIGSLSYPNTAYIDTTGSNNVIYMYTVRYNNGCGLSTTTVPGAGAADNVDTIPCPVIGNTLHVSKSGTYANITWAASSCPDLANYRIFGTAHYSDPFPSVWDILGNPIATSFNDPLSSNYVAYKALSVDACGNISPN